jgi:adenosylcobinamide-phosphate synthase
MNFAGLMLAGLVIEAMFGWPDWLHRHMRHPVVWLGALISALDGAFNRPTWPHALRYVAGALASIVVIGTTAGAAIIVVKFLPNDAFGLAAQSVFAASLIAGRSLYDHVAAVAAPLTSGDLASARSAVARIVGRDPTALSDAGIARAALESLAENASDGIVAPVFWGAVFGLPGLATYKAINTLDSMIGHRNARHGAFGGFTARLDDLANLIPARLTGTLFAVAALSWKSLLVMLRDGAKHRSPNAGWPEAAMAGALGVRLSGPRAYHGVANEEPWLNSGARDPGAADIGAGLQITLRSGVLLTLVLGAIAWAS